MLKDYDVNYCHMFIFVEFSLPISEGEARGELLVTTECKKRCSHLDPDSWKHSACMMGCLSPSPWRKLQDTADKPGPVLLPYYGDYGYTPNWAKPTSFGETKTMRFKMYKSPKSKTNIVKQIFYSCNLRKDVTLTFFFFQ